MNKYKAVSARYGGYRYDSKFEAGVARDLDLRMRAGEYIQIERQKTLDLRVNGRHVCNYRIDFVATRPDGTLEYIEAKGCPTEAWRIKWSLLTALHEEMSPGSTMTIVWNRNRRKSTVGY